MCPDGASTTTKTVPTDDGGHIPAIYGDFLEVFIYGKAETLPPHRSTDHAIDLVHGYNLPYGRIYNLSQFELTTFNAYISANLDNSFIQRSSLPAVAQICCAKKKDKGERLCVHNSALDKATVNNRNPLLLLSEMLDHGCKAIIFTTLDLCAAYKLIRNKQGDDYTTSLRMWYSQME